MIYIHVPFCRSFCTYCDFYSELAGGCRGDGGLRQDYLLEAYTEALCAEIRACGELLRGQLCGAADGELPVADKCGTAGGLSPKTLYIGGGTPSLMPLEFFERILAELRRVAGVSVLDFEEFTVEVNPEDLIEKGAEYVRGLMALGVNRISMGVQSFDDGILRFMNRRHNAAKAKQAYEILQQAGVENISIDLIFGLPQLSEALWRDTIRQSVVLAPKHISAYQLSIEPGSALAEMVAKGKFVEAGQEECSRQYDILCGELAAAGYNHYEVSNFARHGYEAVHNGAYWSHVPYLGLGPAAHSFLRGMDGKYVRRWNNADIKAYINASKTESFDSVRGGETLTEKELNEEKIMLALRTSKGIDAEYLRNHCEASVLDRLLSHGLLEENVCDEALPEQASNGVADKKSAFRIPEKHFFISDSIISDLF